MHVEVEGGGGVLSGARARVGGLQIHWHGLCATLGVSVCVSACACAYTCFCVRAVYVCVRAYTCLCLLCVCCVHARVCMHAHTCFFVCVFVCACHLEFQSLSTCCCTSVHARQYSITHATASSLHCSVPPLTCK